MADRNAFVSCGEDRSLRIWKLDVSDECQQTVFLPAQSIWSVSVMKNGDIVTGSRYQLESRSVFKLNECTFFLSDGLVRVFTQSPERTADPEVLQAFEEELAATSLNAQLELGGIKASE
jgi:phospholipase A-2-activating protein